jgi:DegV family protein with EDD domain
VPPSSSTSSSEPAGVVVVTDSTAYLPVDSVEQLRIGVVPLQVIVGGAVRAEGSQITPSQVAAALRHGATVSTSRPAPAAFEALYRTAFAGGAASIVSAHLSEAMSGTVDAARIAAAAVGGDIRVIDSRSIGMGLGFAVLHAATLAAAGADASAVEAGLHRTLEATTATFYLDTVEYLRRGGRIGPAQAMIGSALSVKPLLVLRDGRISPLERVRTSARAIERLVELTVTAAGLDPVSIAVHHLDAAARADKVAQLLDARIAALEDLVVVEVGAVVGAHTGPGMVAVVLCKN